MSHLGYRPADSLRLPVAPLWTPGITVLPPFTDPRYPGVPITLQSQYPTIPYYGSRGLGLGLGLGWGGEESAAAGALTERSTRPATADAIRWPVAPLWTPGITALPPFSDGRYPGVPITLQAQYPTIPYYGGRDLGDDITATTATVTATATASAAPTAAAAGAVTERLLVYPYIKSLSSGSERLLVYPYIKATPSTDTGTLVPATEDKGEKPLIAGGAHVHVTNRGAVERQVIMYQKPVDPTQPGARIYAWKVWNLSPKEDAKARVPAPLSYWWRLITPIGLDSSDTKLALSLGPDQQPERMSRYFNGSTQVASPDSKVVGPELKIVNGSSAVAFDLQILDHQYGTPMCAVGPIRPSATVSFKLDPKIYVVVTEPGTYRPADVTAAGTFRPGSVFSADNFETSEFAFDAPIDGSTLKLTVVTSPTTGKSTVIEGDVVVAFTSATAELTVKASDSYGITSCAVK